MRKPNASAVFFAEREVKIMAERNPLRSRDVTVASAVSVSRNIARYPFPCRLSADQKKQLSYGIFKLINAKDGRFTFTALDELVSYQTAALAELGLITAECASDPAGRALLRCADDLVSVMLCEEDHIRITARAPGLDIASAYTAADGIESELGEKLEFAFDDKLGFLSQNPALLGTALRPSVIMHLPALAASGIDRLAASASRLGIMIRGMYGGGGVALGNIYVVSNTVTMGISEKASCDNLRSFCMQLATKERSHREEMIKDSGTVDRVWRAHGILTSARILTCSEMMELLSYERLGACLGITDTDIEKIDRLIPDMQPAVLKCTDERCLDRSFRDEYRAEMIRRSIVSVSE